jgi:hypothetical protein
MIKGTYKEKYGEQMFLSVKEIRAFSYIELDICNSDDSISIQINKKQALEIFKKFNFKVPYSRSKDGKDLYIG